jgi:predicted nucleic acid-binding protein
VLVTFDNSVLCLLLHPDADIPNDPATGKPIERAQDRMSFLVEQLRESGARIQIPAPVLSEFLTFASPDYLTIIHSSAFFEIAPFDERAAIEAAIVLKKALKAGLGKKMGRESNWQKIKVDRQIVAIAKVSGAETIYTTDPDVMALAGDSGIRTVHAAALPLPPSTTPLLDGLPTIGTDESAPVEPDDE